MLSDSPPNLWEDSTLIVFESAKEIAIILNECKKRNVYCCNPFSGFLGLSAGSMLFYVNYFPSYCPAFKNAEKYYNYCIDFLMCYKNHWELGSYYYDLLVHEVKLMQAASSNKIPLSSITVLDHIKDELVDVANVCAPLPKSAKAQIGNLVHDNRQPDQNISEMSAIDDQINWLDGQARKEVFATLGWDYDWGNLTSIGDFFSDRISR